MFLDILHNTVYMLSKKYNFDMNEALHYINAPVPDLQNCKRNSPIKKRTAKKMKKLDVARVIDTDDED